MPWIKKKSLKKLDNILKKFLEKVNLQVNVNSGPFEVDVGKGTVGCGGRA